MEHNITVIESQVDWLTLTKRRDREAGHFVWWANRVVGQEERAGGKRGPFGMHGYDGIRAGRIRSAERGDGFLVQLSGDLAANEVDTAFQYADRCSRIDLAVTIRLDPPYPDLEYDHYLQSIVAHRGEGAHPSSSVILSDDGGATFYLGKRASETMLRVYNKEVESEDPRYNACHRYELEVKGERAGTVFAQLVRTPDRPSWVRGILQWYCDKHDISPLFSPTTPVALVPGLRRRSDLETKLEWLETAVRPTVDWLREFGQESRLLHALGYTPGGGVMSEETLREAGGKPTTREVDL